MWRTGLIDVLPERIDHAIVGVAGGLGRNGLGAALLMRDVGAELLPPGDDPCRSSSTASSSTTWPRWRPGCGAGRAIRRCCRTATAGCRSARRRWPTRRRVGCPTTCPAIAAEGWQRFAERAPSRVATPCSTLRHDLTPLVDALASTPPSFLHGDWKMGNLGIGRDGRTVLSTGPTAGPARSATSWPGTSPSTGRGCPSRRRPRSTRSARPSSVTASTPAPWWERQLGLCLLGTLVQFGWEKALGDEDELGWWCDRATEGARAPVTAQASLAAAYSLSADAWTRGPTRVYGRLAELLVAASPVPFDGALVLDLGAGTGVGLAVPRRPPAHG